MHKRCFTQQFKRYLMFNALALAEEKGSWEEYCRALEGHLAGIGDDTASAEGRIKQESTKKTLEKQVEKYLSEGIFPIPVSALKLPLNHNAQIPPFFFAIGNTEILETPLACVLNSRKPRLINPRDTWFKGTLILLNKLMKQGFSIVSSIGTPGYDIVTYSAWSKKHPLILVLGHALPSMLSQSARKNFFNRYGKLLAQGKTLAFSPFPPNAAIHRKARMVLRDKIITAIAETIAVAAIRKSGNMFSLVLDAIQNDKNIIVFVPMNFDHLTDGNQEILNKQRKKVTPVKTAEPDHDQKNLKNAPRKCGLSSQILDVFPENYLVHYTRRCPGPWPGQTYFEYLNSLVENLPGAFHSAFETLKRILREGTIRAGGKMYRGGIPVVSFTECPPNEILKITGWNKALIRWTFEPYGIAFPKEKLIRAGARPVIYARDEHYHELPENRRYLFQLHEPPGKSWKQEKEWRIKGNLVFKKLDHKDLIAIVQKRDEAREIAGQFPYRVYVTK